MRRGRVAVMRRGRVAFVRRVRVAFVRRERLAARRLPGAATRREPEAGFTLIEVLAALVVFGFLVAGLAEGVRFGLTAYRSQADTIGRNNDLDGTDRLLTSLIAATLPSDDNDDATVVGTAHVFAFTTTLPVALGDPPTRLADAKLLLRNGRLLIALLPHYHATVLAAASGKPDEITLATGVHEVTFSYWDGTGHQWVSTWRSNLPPTLVRLTFGFQGRRHWPPLVIRPVLSSFGS